MADDKTILIRLRDSGRALADPADDVRGRRVRDINGDDLGTVAALVVDAEGEKVRFLRVERGGVMGFGATPSFIPVEAVAGLSDDELTVDLSPGRLAGAPRYDPDLVDEQQYYEKFHGYDGQPPHVSPG